MSIDENYKELIPLILSCPNIELAKYFIRYGATPDTLNLSAISASLNL